MTTKTVSFIFAALCLLAAPARAATNDLTSAIQRGLFEEEANQNLGAAIQAYQSVANQFDKDRKLAATAIFRLGECYRKQGNTNDAAAQYERILREFSDQPTLVTLSRQSLAGMGSAPAAPAATAANETAATTAVVEAEAVTLEAQIAELKTLSKDKLRIAVQQNFPNPVLTSLMQKRTEAEQKLAELQKEYGPQHAEVLKTVALTETIDKQIDEQVQSVLRYLEIKRTAAKKTADTLQAQSATSASPAKNLASGSAPVAATSTEAEEVKRIQALIKDSPDLINAANGNGLTLLQSAASSGNLAVVKVLLENGAAVDGLQQPGLTPLHWAADYGHKAVVDFLLSKGAKVDAQSESGVTPLHLAVRNGYETVAKALLAAGAPVNAQGTRKSPSAGTLDLQFSVGPGKAPLHLAANAGYSGMVELLLGKGADANVEDGEGRTPLSYAVQKHYQAVLQVLLAAHANPNAGRLDLPLATAAYQGDMAALKLLLAHGADPNTNSAVNWGVSRSGGVYEPASKFTPLFLAVKQQKAEAAKELLRCKADPNLPGPGGDPLLYEALSDTPTLKVLLEGGADPNVRISNGRLMLLVAVWDKNQPAVELLLAHQADVNATNSAASDGWTPLHYAAAYGPKAIAELLLKAGEDVNARNKDGETPLILAVRNGQLELAELLLANKADPNERDNSGETPLALAKSRRPSQQAIVDLLRRHGALDDLPNLDQIEVRRGANRVNSLFVKGAHDWNQFTLLELLAMKCDFLAGSPRDEGGDGYSADAFFSTHSAAAFFSIHKLFPFPDVAHMHIRRPAPDLKSWKEQVVDLRPVLASGDCSKDVRLEWGDVVEIPEADHPLNEKWPGFSTTELANLKKCLTRQVGIVISGQATNITLAPQISNVGEEKEAVTAGAAAIQEPIIARMLARQGPQIVAHTPFWLKPVLLQSKLVLTSSDLRHVKVTRHDAASGQEREWVVDCSEASPAPDFWLRDGDKIEVPEKTDSASAEETTTTTPSSPGLPVSPPAPGTRASRSGLPINSGGVLRLPATETPPAVEKEHPRIGGVLYSPKPEDPELLKAGYHKDRSARTRKAENWEERAGSKLRGRGGNTAVWTGTDLIVFGGEGPGTSYDDGARYCLAEDTWAALPEKGAPSSRTGHAAVWTGKEMIVWGGFGGVNGDDTNHNDGARYNPATDTWRPVSTKNAPAARFDFPAVWTGREMLVWGGYTDSHSRYQGGHADAHLNSGGRYDPSSDSWKTLGTDGAPSRRCGHTLVWTGKEMIVWGGGNATKALNDGGRYSPARDSWRPVSADGAPSPRVSHVAVWTGKEMIVWGGSAREPEAQSDYYENGARYNPETDTWKPISTVGAPKGRVLATAVWTGTEMIVWGGVNDAQAAGVNDSGRFVGIGARYNPATDSWTEMTTTGAPPARLTSGVWTGDGLLAFGGYNGGHLNDTWFYSPQRTLYPFAKQ